AQAEPADCTIVAAVDSHLGDWFCALADDAVPFVASVESLRTRLHGRSCRIVGSGVAALATGLLEAGGQAVAEEAGAAARGLARLAARQGGEAWRVRNRQEGLPRPLYLRGVNVTLPDGARRTVE